MSFPMVKVVMTMRDFILLFFKHQLGRGMSADMRQELCVYFGFQQSPPTETAMYDLGFSIVFLCPVQ